MVSSKAKNDKMIRVSILNSNKENKDTTVSELAVDKGKQRKDSKDSKKSKASKSSSSTLTACQLEQLEPTSMDLNLSHLQAKLAPSTEDTLAQLKIGRRHSSYHHHQDLNSLSTLSTPTSDFSPSPTSMGAPSMPLTPLSPGFFSSSSLSAEPLSMFEEGNEHEEEISELPDLDGPPRQEPKRKRLSTGSMQLGQFFANTFKPKHRRSTSTSNHSATMHPDLSTVKRTLLVPNLNDMDTPPAETTASSKPPKQRKRRSFFAKSPKLETRQTPKIVISAPIKGKTIAPKIIKDGRDPQKSCDEQKSAEESGAGSPPFVFTPALLSPFYLPSLSHSRTCTQDVENSDRLLALPNGGATDDNLEYDEKAAPPNLRGSQWDMDWRHNSRVYHDDRWDRASVLSVDSEMIRLAEDPDFPGYPERNAYWEQHCQIRERRWKQQLQQYAQDKDGPTGRWMKNKAKAGATKSISEGSTSMPEEEEDEGAEDGTQRNKRFHHVNMLLHTAANPAEAARAAAQQAQQAQDRPRRTRYSSYSAYVAAIQLKSRNRTDRMRYSVDAIATSPPRDDLPRISPKLIEDVRALKDRSLQQKAEQRPNYVRTITDRFEGVSESDSEASPVRNDVPVVPPIIQKKQPQALSPLDAFGRGGRGMGINTGSSDEDDDQSSYRTPAQRIRADYQISQGFPSPQRQRQPDSGILFVASTTTTAEVFPGLNHDPQAPLSNPRIGYIQSAVHNTGSAQDGGGLPALKQPHSTHNDPSLSRPGQYASHHHIMPLDQLLRLQEEQQQIYRQLKQQQLVQQQQNNPKYPDETNLSSSARLADTDATASSSHSNNNNNNTIFTPNLSQSSVSPTTLHQQHFDTSLQLSAIHQQQIPQQQQLQYQQPDPNTQGHMLLMLCQGHYHYYKNGTRKQELEWDEYRNEDDTMEDAQMQSFGNQNHIGRLFDDEMIEEGGENAHMEDTDNADEESNKRKYSTMAHKDRKGKGKSRSVSRAATGGRHLSPLDAIHFDQSFDSLERKPSDDNFSSASKTERRPFTFYSESSPELDPLLQEPLPPSPRSSGPKVGRIRGTKTRASVSYTVLPTMAEPATIPSYPSFASTSTSTLFLTSSSSSQMAPHLLRHRGSGSMTSGTLTGTATPSSMTSRSARTRSWADLSHYPTPSSASMMLLDSLSTPMKVAYMLQPGSKQQQRKAESQGGKKGGRSLTVTPLSPRAETDPLMGYKDDEEADKEMGQEPVDEAQGDVSASPSNKVSKKRFRAMTMVDLSAISPLQLKAEPSTSTSTMVTLHSEERYQWNQFFDV
ncbi:hypothetical protein BG006_006388 [Podila minutissima]|uniref:Uncharacterized protein n=1 Tax=Podila minutissima TaxID=64525 RepID=A0A9P5SUF8_9FUNG|nr:hypothetical protein BG006_006388 [Podila minutissima]